MFIFEICLLQVLQPDQEMCHVGFVVLVAVLYDQGQYLPLLQPRVSALLVRSLLRWHLQLLRVHPARFCTNVKNYFTHNQLLSPSAYIIVVIDSKFLVELCACVSDLTFSTDNFYIIVNIRK